MEAYKAMVRLIARVIGVGIETADMLVNEILGRARLAEPLITISRWR
jgi:hypothetical protein